jgi:hypothetical protein
MWKNMVQPWQATDDSTSQRRNDAIGMLDNSRYKVVSPTHWPPLPPANIPPATFQFVAHTSTTMPPRAPDRSMGFCIIPINMKSANATYISSVVTHKYILLPAMSVAYCYFERNQHANSEVNKQRACWYMKACHTPFQRYRPQLR